MGSDLKQYLDLWTRLDAVVTELTRRGEEETGNYFMVGFFLEFPELDALERFVKNAEQARNELDVQDKGESVAEATLAAIERRCSAATRGPWVAYIEGRDHESGSDFVMRGPEENRAEDLELSGASSADIDFIAHARQAVPILVAEVRRLRALQGG